MNAFDLAALASRLIDERSKSDDAHALAMAVFAEPPRKKVRSVSSDVRTFREQSRKLHAESSTDSITQLLRAF